MGAWMGIGAGFLVSKKRGWRASQSPPENTNRLKAAKRSAAMSILSSARFLAWDFSHFVQESRRK